MTVAPARVATFVSALLLLVFLMPAACDKAAAAPFVVYSGSENEALEPIVKEFGRSLGFDVSIVYMGSVDIANALQGGKAIEADAVWPASRLWLALGDTQKVVRDDASIMREPAIFGVKQSVAARLGWTRNPAVTLKDVLEAAQAGKFRYAATSATQSNSGAALYFAALQATSQHPDQALQEADLDQPAAQQQMKALFATVNRSSASSGWLEQIAIG
jgi:Ca-activated chloride channel family protein